MTTGVVTLYSNAPQLFPVTTDVVVLYTNILQHHVILAVKEALKTQPNKQRLTWVLLQILHLVLNKTVFKFNQNFYK